MAETIYDFNAGPAMLPPEVIEEARTGLFDWRGTGKSVLEMGHRSDEFDVIIGEAETDLRGLLGISADYETLFLQGGATGQFADVPRNLANERGAADYIITGAWSKKAAAEAGKHLQAVNIAAQSSPFTKVPDQHTWQLTPKAAYTHITPNETIDGVAFGFVPEVSSPLVADMSSLLLSGPCEVDRYGVIYASAQKNIGIAGLTVVIALRDLLGRARKSVEAAGSWAAQAKEGSRLNTPPTVSIYMAGLVLKWLQDQGGLEAISALNHQKAKALYTAIDESTIYMNRVSPPNRSFMNVPFILTSEAVESRFLKAAAQNGLVNLRGHRSVGGVRASIYNAMPLAGVQKLTEFMRWFQREEI